MERLEEPEIDEGGTEDVPSGHDRTPVLMNSQQLWLPASSTRHLRTEGKGVHEPSTPSIAEELWGTDGF